MNKIGGSNEGTTAFLFRESSSDDSVTLSFNGASFSAHEGEPSCGFNDSKLSGINRNLPNFDELQIINDIRESPAIEAKISQLKKLGANINQDIRGDYYLGRFLKAANGDKNIAADMYEKSLDLRLKDDGMIERYRKEVQHLTVEGFYEWWQKRCSPWFPIFPYCGETPDGDMVVWIRAGVIDPERLLRDKHKEHQKISFAEEERMILSLYLWLNTQMDMRIRDPSHCRIPNNDRLGGQYRYCIKIFDFKRPFDYDLIEPKPQFPLFNPQFYSFFMTVANKVSILFPEMDAAVVVTNPTNGFKRFWKLCKMLSFVSKSTIDKVTICKDTLNEEDQKAALHTVVHRSVLPRPWGGFGVHEKVKESYCQPHGTRLNLSDQHKLEIFPEPCRMEPSRRRRSIDNGIQSPQNRARSSQKRAERSSNKHLDAPHKGRVNGMRPTQKPKPDLTLSAEDDEALRSTLNAPKTLTKTLLKSIQSISNPFA